MSPRLSGLVLALVLACNRTPAGTDTTASTTAVATHSDPWVTRAVTSVGEHATFVAVVHPERWPALHARLGKLPLPPEQAAQLASIADANQWFAAILHALRPVNPDAPGPPIPTLEWTGWDRTRPVIIAIGAVPLDVPTGLLTAHLSPGNLPGMQHTLVVPASDPAALTAALARGLSTLGEPRPGFVHALPGASAWALGERDTLAVIPGDDHVRVILDVGATAPADVATIPDLSPRPAARFTAGLVALAQDDAAALLIRPHRLPAFDAWTAAREIHDLAARLAPVDLGPARRTALASLAGCEKIWGAEPLEFDDYAISLAADDHGLHLRGVASLTPRGEAAIDAATRSDALPLALVRPAALDAWLRLDTTAAAASTGAPITPLVPDDDLGMLTTCGSWRALFSPTAPFAQTARLQAGILGDTPLPTLQTAVGQLAITDAAARHAGISMLTDPAIPLATLEAQLGGYAQLFDAKTTVVSEREGDRQRVRATYNTAPADVFGAPSPADGLAHLHADLTAVRPLLASVLPGVDLLTDYNRLTGAVRRSGHALVADLELTTGDPAPRPLDLGATTWQPLPAPAQPRCAQDYAHGLRRLIRSVGGTESSLDDATPPLTADTALAALAALQPALTCLAADRSIDTNRLHADAADQLVDALLARYQYADATRVVTATCDAGVPAACARKTRLTTAILPNPPRVALTCQGIFMNPARTLAITAAGSALDGAPIATPEALRAALATTDRAPSLGLTIDGDVPFAALRPTLAVLADLAAKPPGLRLTYTVFTTDDPDPIDLPLATPRLGPDPADPLASASPTGLLGARTITLTGDVPDDTSTGSIGVPLQVAPDDTTRWQAITAALARSCTGATLIARPTGTPSTPSEPSKGLIGGGTLDKDIIRRIVRAHINEVRYCYNQALARDPNAKGRVSVQFTIAGNGKVASATLQDSTLADSDAAQCIAGAVRRWTFPKPEGGGSVVVTYPFVLEPG